MSSTNTGVKSLKQPAIFIPHGAGPCFFMDWNPADAWNKMAAFLKGIAATLPEQPKAILMVSAHWLDADFKVTGHVNPELIYDYYGFPAHTYELKYSAPGDPALAQKVVDLLQQQQLTAGIDAQRGFDHGMFIPLKLMFPAANIPVVQLSLRQDLDPLTHVQVGQALASLREEGVLIVGSGMSFHNMRGYGDQRFTPLSEEFDTWLTDAVTSSAPERAQLLTNWSKAPQAYACHPQGHEEHLLPLMVVAGASSDPGHKAYSEVVMETRLSAYRFD